MGDHNKIEILERIRETAKEFAEWVWASYPTYPAPKEYFDLMSALRDYEDF